MKYLGWIIGVAALVGVIWWASRTPVASTNTATDQETVVVFLTKMTETDMEFVPVERRIPKTGAIEQTILATIEQLLKGPTNSERDQGLSVAFNAGTKVNAVNIVGNVLTVDFNPAFDTPMGGSARVRSISQSLERTIQQFPLDGVNEIRYTVDHGKRAAVLEP